MGAAPDSSLETIRAHYAASVARLGAELGLAWWRGRASGNECEKRECNQHLRHGTSPDGNMGVKLPPST
jgi:hypothetical protein